MAADSEDLDAALRRHDPDRWLASRFIADPAARADVVALYAFNHELARVAGAVSNALMGEIRLTWWSEALAEIYEGRPVRRHPVSLALADAVKRHALPRAMLDVMIEARFPELDGQAADVSGEEGLILLTGKSLGVDVPAATATAVVHLYRTGQGRAEANRLVQDLPVTGFPAVAHASLAGRSQAGALARRLRLSWAVLTGRL